ncbi:HlyD family type I secretion periplasmic adaptor subunit [Ahrensia sp. R2A130]|uniref:HlyD family type I secretion periplasmic adaptor subunit n=1 Tax=Ahrensia sp. R2A130 TaxID=744979 RepID=UPI0001E0CA0D|nr:HlyD family type I secretion periplasmic adaptor subunit [Ahrensia sp. R2A130]EFL88825.1 putative alkaline protease secretion protein AprE [Ahrensia sp. R2A130]
MNTSARNAATAAATGMRSSGNAAPAQPTQNSGDWRKQVPTANGSIVRKGLIFVFGFLGLFVIWAFAFPIASAVVASGKIVSSGQNKLIQHPTGGVVRSISVQDGSQVAKGDVLLVLDDSANRAEFTRLTARHQRLTALKTRLEAENSGGTFQQPADTGLALRGTQAASPSGEETAIFNEQRREFEAGRKRLNAELDAAVALAEAQKEQLVGLQTRIAASRQLLAQTDLEISRLRPLANAGDIAKSRLWEVERRRLEQARDVGDLDSQIASTMQRIAEGEARVEQLAESDNETRSEELTGVLGELREISDQLNAARSAVELTELRSPVDGTVTALIANTIGGVVPAGELVAQIVPTGSELEAEFRVAPTDVNSVNVGQKARIVVTAFNRRTYEPVEGEVTYVSADSQTDASTGETYFLARASLLQDVEKNQGIAQIQPGMQTEVYALKTPRNFVTYAVQPVLDSFSKAFRQTD